MYETIEIIMKRRSIRRFSSLQVSDEAVETLLQCALYAPSGHNRQLSRFIVLQGDIALGELNGIIQQELAGSDPAPGSPIYVGAQRAREEGYQFCYQAPTLITAVAPRDYPNAMADCACALENVMLAATALGLGSCWSNQAHWLTDVPAIRAFFARYGLREEEDIFGSVAVGYGEGPYPTAALRKDGRIEWNKTEFRSKEKDNG